MTLPQGVNFHGFTLVFTTEVSCEFQLRNVLAVVVNRRNRKHRTTVCVRTIRYEIRKHEQTACSYIPLPSYLI